MGKGKKDKGLRIISLEAENVKRLRAVHIEPSGDMVVIGGNNGQGKTSVLDSIEMALGGKNRIPRRPVRDGEDTARVICDMGSLIVRRTFTADGKTSVVVETNDGARYASPQHMLDELVGGLSFDPLEFTRLPPPKQLEVLRELVGIDFAELNGKRDSHYRGRTDANRRVKELTGQMAGTEHHGACPETEISITDLVAELETAQKLERVHEVAADRVTAANAAFVHLREHTLTERQQDVVRARDMLAQAEARVADTAKEMETTGEAIVSRRADEVAALEAIPDIVEINGRLAGAEDINRKVRENANRARIEANLAAAVLESETLTGQINGVDATKRKLVEAADFPIDGLALDDDGVTFGGIPFEQGSQAEQLRVSVAIGLAMNPKLRVLLIRDGSLLDADSMGLLAKLATDAGAQIWLERVGDTDDCAVIIEDGMVRGTSPAAVDDGTVAP